MNHPLSNKPPSHEEAAASGGLRQRRDRAPFSLIAMLVLGGSWSAFFWRLARDGQQPSGPLLLPIARENYYRFEAFCFPLWVLAAWLVAATISHTCAKQFGGEGSWSNTVNRTGYAISMPMGLAWLLPDCFFYLRGGFASMAQAMRIYAPIASLSMVALFAVAMAKAHNLKPRAAVGIGLLGAISYSATVSVLLR